MEFDWKNTHKDNGYLVTAPDDTILRADSWARRFLGLSAGVLLTQVRFRDTAIRHYRCEPEDAWAGWPAQQERSEEVRYLIRPETPDAPSSWLQVELTPQSPEIPYQRLIRLHDVSEAVTATRRAWILQGMISRKLKNPLTTLNTCLEIMNLDRNLLPPEMQELVDLSRLSLNRLQLDVTEIEQGGEQLASPGGSPFRLAELPDLLDRLTTIFQLRRVTLTGTRTTANLSLTSSFMAVETILAELLKNAKKFHPEQDPSVVVTVALQDDERVAVRVTDDGSCLHGKQNLAPWLQGAEGPTGEDSTRGRGLPLVAALAWESGGSFRIYNRADVPGVVAEVVLPLTGKRQTVQGGSPCRT